MGQTETKNSRSSGGFGISKRIISFNSSVHNILGITKNRMKPPISGINHPQILAWGAK